MRNTPIQNIEIDGRAKEITTPVSAEGGDTHDTIDSPFTVSVISQEQNKGKRINKSPNPNPKRGKDKRAKRHKKRAKDTMGNIRNMKEKAMSKQKLCNIEQEIITTEKNYFDQLSLLLNELILPMFEKKILDTKYYYKIVSSLFAIID